MARTRAALGSSCDRTSEDQRLTVRYEDLIRDPEQCLSRICEFLGVNYHPTMLEIEDDTTYSRPDSSLIEQWRHKLTPKEVQWVECQCADLMQQRGYKLASPSLKEPGTFQRAGIGIQNRWYRISFSVKRWGFGTWFLFVLSKRLKLNGLRNRMLDRINQIDKQYLK